MGAYFYMRKPNIKLQLSAFDIFADRSISFPAFAGSALAQRLAYDRGLLVAVAPTRRWFHASS